MNGSMIVASRALQALAPSNATDGDRTHQELAHVTSYSTALLVGLLLTWVLLAPRLTARSRILTDANTACGMGTLPLRGWQGNAWGDSDTWGWHLD